MDPSFKSSTEVIDSSSVSTYSDDESGNFLVDSSSSDAGNLHSPPSVTPAKTAAPSNELKAAFVKTVESLKVPSLAKKEKLELLNKLVEFSSVIIDIKDAIPISNFIQGIRLFVVHQNKTIRTASLRVLRYYMRTDEFIAELISQKLHFFISRSLDREKQNEAERMQALKLVRKIMEVNCSLLPRCIVHSLVSIAENAEDNFSRVAIETICEITIRNPRLSAHCNGIKLLILSILDPNLQGLQESLLLALIYLLNNADTRKYIRPSLDIALLLGPLTDNFYPKDRTPEKESKWAVSVKALVSMLKTWTGLIVLASHPLGLKSLVNALRLPFTELHDRILDAIFDIFKLTVAKESNPFQFKSQSRSVDESATPDVGMDIGQELPSRTRGERHNLLNNYLSALLISFMDCGLLETLVELGSKPKDNNEERNNIAIKSTLLLGELLYLTNTLLPPSQCAKVQTLPKLVEYAASFELDSRLRSRAASMVSNLHQYHHLKHASSFYDFHLALIVTGANKWKRLKGRDRRLDRMDEVKLKIDFAMDADQFKNKIQDTQVLTTKDAQRWKWDIISDLLEGPLNNPNLVTYALLKTKFVKRILSFLRPQAKVFAKMAWSLKNLKYVRMACQLLEVLVSSDAGKDYLCNSKLIPEIAEQLDLEVLISNQKEDPKKENRLLKAEGVLKTMSREYFTMLGTLSSSPRGLEILNKFNIFKYLLDLTEIQGRVDLSHLIMTSLDYNMASGQARTILGKALNSASKVVRYLATRHMGILLRAGVQDFSEWGIDYLVKQLSDPDSKVTRSALSILDEACDEVENMDSLISKRPTVLLKLNQAGKDLWLRFLSRSSGFKFLVENEFVQREMKIWKDKLNKEYVNNVERALAESFSPAIYKHRESDHGGDGVYLSPHFYGELTKTKEGAEVLENSKHFLEFVATIKNKNNADTLEVKAALWAIGNIGASKTGFVFLEKEKAVQMIVQLADECPSLSVRGTCFYVLGMLSRTEQAREILDSLGWESPANLNSCISVPKNIKSSTFFKLSEEKYEGSLATSDTIEYYNPKEVNEIQMEIITAVGHLSNSISAESASRTLKRLRALHPEYFASPALLYQVFKLLGTYKFRLPVRRFIYDIFDGVTMEENQWDSFTE